MDIPMLDLLGQYEQVGKAMEKVVLEVLRSQQLVLGHTVQNFEQEMASYTGARFTIGVASGSDALLLAMMALDLGPDDAVVTSPFTFFATASAIHRVGARPVFVDIDQDSFNLDPQALKRYLEEQCSWSNGRLTDKRSGKTVKAILPVHLYGQTADMDPILDLAGRYNLAVVEDVAQAIGAWYAKPGRKRMAGVLGDLGCFSFYPTKNLGGLGDGGMLVTQNETLARRLKLLRNHGDAGGYDHREVGINSRLDALQAAALSEKLSWLDHWAKQRVRNAGSYNEMIESKGLADRIKAPTIEYENGHVFNQYTIQVDERDELARHLKEQKIGCAVYYPIPLHLQACFSYLGYKAGDLPVGEKVCTRCLSLPIFPELKYVQQMKVIDAIDSFFKKR